MKKAYCFFALILFSCLPAEVYITFPANSLSTIEDGYYNRQRLSKQLIWLFSAYRSARKFDATLVAMPMDVDLLEPLQKRVKCIDFSEFYKIKKYQKTDNLRNLHGKNRTPNPEVSHVFTPSSSSLLREFHKIKNASFKGEFKDILFEACPEFCPPEKREILTIAVHIRNGASKGFSLFSKQFFNKKDIEVPDDFSLPAKKVRGKYLDLSCSDKAPPLQFYVDSITYFLKHITTDVNFVVFTDYEDKELLVDQLREHITHPVNIEPYRANSIDPKLLELNEILTMSLMDGIIRPSNSTFSLISLCIADYTYYMQPSSYCWKGNHLLVSQALIYENGQEKRITFD